MSWREIPFIVTAQLLQNVSQGTRDDGRRVVYLRNTTSYLGIEEYGYDLFGILHQKQDSSI
jgi:hypothetical protein